MSSLTTSTYRLFDGYRIPTNKDHHYVCLRCGHTTRRNRREWIHHFKQCDLHQFNSVVLGIRAINGGIRKIDDHENQVVVGPDVFQLLNEGAMTTGGQDDNRGIEEKLQDLINARKNGSIDSDQFFAAVEKLCAKKVSS